ncbi:MAG: sensor domain-containing diguanylate cyclase [Planctomycetales bacterium]|nr:sensor domain-containing diguanylate cyclase [Planctomycetales bacterium]
MASLTVLEGPRPGERFALSALGAGETRDLVSGERRAGTIPLRVRRDPDGFRVEAAAPAGAEGGTPLRVNGEPPGGTPLAHGDVVAAGGLVLIFGEDDEDESRDPAASDLISSRIEWRLPAAADAGAALGAAAGSPGGAAEALLALGAALAGERRAADVLARAAEAALDVLRADRTAALAFRSGHRGVRAAVTRERPGLAPGPPPRVARAVADQVAAAGATVLSRDSDGGRERVALCAPLRGRRGVLGLLHAEVAAGAPRLGEVEARLLAAIALLSGGALEAALSADDRERYGRRLRSLAAASRRLPTLLRREAILQEAAALAAATLSCARTSILLRDDAGELRVAGGVGIPEAVAGRESAPASGVAATVLHGRRPVRVADATAPGAPAPAAPPGRYRSRSYLAVPIVARGGEGAADVGAAVGVFCATERRAGGPFSSEDADLLAILASATGAALAAAEMHEALSLDALTGVASRRYFDARLAREVRLARQGAGPLALVLLDLDRFKSVNDTHGHPAGDRVLRAAGGVLARAVRGDDLAARTGGEEFALLLPGAGAEDALAVAERVRADIAAGEIRLPEGEGGGARVRVTASAGVAVLAPGEGPADFVARADRALYRAKRGGRDRVVPDGPAPPRAPAPPQGAARRRR